MESRHYYTFVIIDLNHKGEDNFVAIDHGSGGYPYNTSLLSAKKFLHPGDAEEYMNMFSKENWKLEKLVYYTVDI